MEREQSNFLLHSSMPVAEEENNDFSGRKSSWSTASHLRRQREYCFEDKAHKTKRLSSDESGYIEPIKSLSSKKANKAHVPSACANCKKAHLACDVSRPCKRCIAMGKTDTCIDIQHKKRGRPKIKHRKSNSCLHDSNYSQIINLTPAASTTIPTPIHTPIPTIMSNPVPPCSTQIKVQSTSIQSSSHTTHNNVSCTFHGSVSYSNPSKIYMETPSYPISNQGSSVPIHTTSTQSLLSLPSHHTSHFQNQSNADLSQSLHLNLYDPSKAEDHISQNNTITHSSESNDFVMMLNFKMDCAMISEEYHGLLGYTSQDLVHRSLYDIVHITDTDRIENLKSQLIDHVVKVVTQYQGSFLAAPLREGFGCSLTIEDIQKQTYAKLISPASGSEDFTEAIHIRRKDGGYELFNVQMRVGGAFGTDLTSIDTYDKAYVICKLAKFQLPSLLLNTHHYSNNNSAGPGPGPSTSTNPEVPFHPH